MVLGSFAAIGEAMLEFGRADLQLFGQVNSAAASVSPVASPTGLASAALYQLSFSGDTYNTLFYYQHYAALSAKGAYYVTALGEDALSEQMITKWRADGICVDYVVRLADKLPGLYLISLDRQGEREFIYYRSQSAARELCSAPSWENIANQLSQFDCIYFSGITLAIYNERNRQRLLDLLQAANTNGAHIVFDTNYRSALWDSPEQAQAAIAPFYPVIDCALPTYEDEHLLFGDRSPQATIERLQAAGVKEVVVKQGAEGCTYSDGGALLHADALANVTVVDTTAAGDSFNGCYLAHRAAGVNITEAVARAQKVAAVVIGQAGALVGAHLPVFI